MRTLKDVAIELKQNESILIQELENYGSIKKQRVKGKRSCVHCTSSDGLGVYYRNEYKYKCFSCGNGGDVVNLVKNQENTDFVGAIKILANKYGIEIPSMKYSKEDKKKFYARKKVEEFKTDKVNHLKQIQSKAYKDGNINKAFEIESIIDGLNITNTEHINYTKYKPTKIYKIDKYISKNIEGLQVALMEANQGKKVLVLAPTGSGKTDSTINEIKKNELYRACFISPNASNVEQIMNKYEIPGAYGVELNGDTALKDNNIGVVTWDKFSSLKDTDLSKYVAVVDEIHQTFNDMYRSEKIKGLYNNLEKCKGRIDITATPNKLDLSIYDLIIVYEQDTQTKHKVYEYTDVNESKIIEIINNSKKFALLENDTKNLQYYQACTSKKTDVVSRDFIDSNRSNTYDDIMRNSSIGDYQGILNTSVIVAGVNIYDSDITDIIIVNEKDISTIKQYVARFRDLKEVNVHIFNRYEDNSTTYSLEWLVKERIEEAESIVNAINASNKRKYTQCTINLTPFRLETSNHFYLDEETQMYKVDIPGIRNEVYTKYYRKADVVSFKYLLKEYFDTINTIYISDEDDTNKKEFRSDLKEQEEEAREKLMKHLDILVGANEILKNKISPKVHNYMVKNGLNETDILNKLNKNAIPGLLTIGKNNNLIKLYTKYVVENSFTYELSWYLANLGNKKRGKIFNQLNLIVFNMVRDNHENLLNYNLVENRLIELIVNGFKPGISYTKEHLELFIELLAITLPGIKLTTNKLSETIRDLYVVEETRHRSVHQVDYNYYKNISPTPCTPKQIKINTIKDFRKIDDIVKEHGLSEISQKNLENIIKKRFRNITESNEALEILKANEIFTS